MDRKPTYEHLLERVRQLEKTVEEGRQAARDLEREKVFSEKVLSSLPGIFWWKHPASQGRVNPTGLKITNPSQGEKGYE